MRIERLQFIAEHCPQLRVEALKMALTFVQRTFNVDTYEEIHRKLTEATRWVDDLQVGKAVFIHLILRDGITEFKDCEVDEHLLDKLLLDNKNCCHTRVPPFVLSKNKSCFSTTLFFYVWNFSKRLCIFHLMNYVI